MERKGEVDSEVIFRLLDTLPMINGVNSYLREIMFYVKHLKVNDTTLSEDIRNPFMLKVARHFTPISYHYQRDWEALTFSTRYAFLRKKIGVSVIDEIIPNAHVMIFNASKIRTLRGKPEAWSVIE